LYTNSDLLDKPTGQELVKFGLPTGRQADAAMAGVAVIASMASRTINNGNPHFKKTFLIIFLASVQVNY
jgi:hypothetical protein